MKSVFLISCLIALASASISVSAERYFKWVDRNGVTHYSETSPTDTQVTVVKVKAGRPSTESKIADIADTSTTEATVGSGEKPQVMETPQPTGQQLEVQRSNCSKASRKLIALENAGFASWMNRPASTAICQTRKNSQKFLKCANT
jgi:hypothetical protein